MQLPGVNPALLRLLATGGQEQATDLLTPGRILKAEVISVFQDRAVLSFGRGIRLEAQTLAALKEGQQVTVQVQTPPQPGMPAPLVLKLVQNPAFTGQTNTAITQPAPGEAGQPPAHAVWLPIPTPTGGQAWTQLHVLPEAPRRSQGISPARQIRIWWETPELGAVQVMLDSESIDLSAIFTVVNPESRTQIESNLAALQARLAEAGFPEARLGCRQARPGEAVEPFRPDGPHRLDTRF